VQHVTVSGELGSGKTAIAAALSARLGADVVSTGAIHRRIAAERGASALETNLIAERDGSIDELIDGELVRLGAEPDRIIFDSRMAWHFVPGALKIHLVVDPRVAAERMAGREATSVEGYRSVDEAQAKAAERQASERRRFLATYDVDIDRLRNYDVVMDTTNTGVEALADILEAIVADPDDLPPPPHLLLSAQRLAASSDDGDDGDGDGDRGDSGVARDRGATHEGHSTHDGGDADGATATADAVHVAYARPHLAVLAGHDLVAATVARGGDIVPGVLVAEGEEEVTPGRQARHVVADDSAATSA
jgi:cytidylate kinase